MDEKEIKIGQAALAQFAKFGVRKTTMQDVADAAHISRQTLYNYVAHKEALLKLAARTYFTDNISRCEAELESVTNLSDAFDILIQYFIAEPWQTMKAMPEASDFEASTHDVIADEVQEATHLKKNLIITYFFRFDHAQVLSVDKVRIMAQFFCASAAGIKSTALTEDELLDMSTALKITFLAALEPASEAA